MGTPPNLQVYDLGHPGLVVSVLGRIRLAETVGHLAGSARVSRGASYSMRTFSYLLRLEARTSPQGPMAIAVPFRCVTP